MASTWTRFHPVGSSRQLGPASICCSSAASTCARACPGAAESLSTHFSIRSKTLTIAGVAEEAVRRSGCANSAFSTVWTTAASSLLGHVPQPELKAADEPQPRACAAEPRGRPGDGDGTGARVRLSGRRVPQHRRRRFVQPTTSRVSSSTRADADALLDRAPAVAGRRPRAAASGCAPRRSCSASRSIGGWSDLRRQRGAAVPAS